MMALMQQPHAISDGQFTSTVYGFIRDHEWQDAIDVLQLQLQVRSVAKSSVRAHKACRQACLKAGGHAMSRRHGQKLLFALQFYSRTTPTAALRCRSWATATSTPASMSWLPTRESADPRGLKLCGEATCM